MHQSRKEYTKFNADTVDLTFQLRHIRKDELPQAFIHEAMSGIIDSLKGEAEPDDQLGFLMMSRNPSYQPIWVSLRRVDQFDTDIVLSQIEKIIQSNKEFLLAGPIDVRSTRVKSFNGFARVKDRISPSLIVAQKKKSVVQINNTDNLCLPRALITGIALTEKDESESKKLAYNNLCKGYPIQRKKALELCVKAHVDIDQIGGGVEALRLFQNYLKNYKITVFSDTTGEKVLFDDEKISAEKNIDLWYHDEHYSLIRSMTGFVGSNYFCRPCKARYSAKKDHRCPLTCKRCLNNPKCEPDGSNQLCRDCGIYFLSGECFRKHKLPYFPHEKTVCQTIQYCKDCRKIYSLVGIKEHKCHHTKCSNCHNYVPYTHLCYIQQLKAPKKPKGKKFTFFDLECRQDTCENGARIHIANFAVVQNQCTKCLNNTNLKEDCAYCGQREHIIGGSESKELFARLFDIFRQNCDKFETIYIFAHNLRGYDGQFVLKYMVEELKWEPEIIMNGGLIQSIKYDKMVFRDTLNFFNAPLSVLPKMMGIEGAKKGYFPHFFNTVANQEYVGEIPDPEYYGVNELTTDKRISFLEWWAQEKSAGKQFDFREEMKAYCYSDVDILRKAALKFRDLFLKTVGIDPLESITIAGACMKLFRTKYLKPQMIGLMPYNGYRSKDRQSVAALKWLKYMEHEHGIEIKTADKGLEIRIGGFKVDGFSDDFNGQPTIFEYHVGIFIPCKKISNLKSGINTIIFFYFYLFSGLLLPRLSQMFPK